MSDLRVRPATCVRGTITVPGDKSVTHRAFLLTLLADGACELDGVLEGDDCLRTCDAARSLGADIERTGPGRYSVRGAGWSLRPPAGGAIDLGNSGTGMRLLAGILAGQTFEAVLSGDASLSSRPMGRVVRPLRAMGAEVRAEGEGERPPLRIRGVAGLHGIMHEPEAASAQVKSCVLLAGLFADEETVVVEPAATRDHTERMFAFFGLPLVREGLRVATRGGARPVPGVPARDMRIPGDPSAAAFFAVAAAAMPGSDLVLRDVMLNPTRTRFLDVLSRMGAGIDVVPAGEGGSCPERIGTVRVRGAGLRGTEIGGAEIPLVIDELPALAVAASAADGPTTVRDARELRFKESDRIAGVVGMLRAFGAGIEESEDGFKVAGRGDVRAAAFDSRGDHRLAMSAAILALRAREASRIEGAEWIRTSFPGFDLLLNEVSAA